MDRLPRATPAESGVNPDGILAFMDAFEKKNGHSFMVLRHGRVVAEAWYRPYRPEYLHPLFSVSKSFTCLAAGFAVQDGLLSVEAGVADFFPELLSCEPCENMRKMRVEHLLTMTTGHVRTDPIVFYKRKDWLRAFLRSYVEREPGTLFTYNNTATNVLAAILQKRTGKSLSALLEERLFAPLGIAQYRWNRMPDGAEIAAYGLSLTTEDLAKTGQLLLQNGMWEGRQLLSPDWIPRITAARADNSESPWPVSHSRAGYGYQFWRLGDGVDAYRMDGAKGQLCVMFPELDAVVVTTAGAYLDYELCGIICDTLVPAMTGAPSIAAAQPLMQRLDGAEIPPLRLNPTHATAAEYSGRTWQVSKNPLGITAFSLTFGESDTLTVQFSGGTGVAVIGKDGVWKESDTYGCYPGDYHLADLVSPEVACTGGWDGDCYRVRMVSTRNIFTDDLSISFFGRGAVLRILRSPSTYYGIAMPGDRGCDEHILYGVEVPG